VVLNTDAEIDNALVSIERMLYPARRIFAEHEIATVCAGECPFVLALDCRLHRGAERLLDSIEESNQIEGGAFDEPRSDSGGAALRMRGGRDTFLGAEPCQDHGEVQWPRVIKFASELLLNELT